jgi:hypothetical protein
MLPLLSLCYEYYDRGYSISLLLLLQQKLTSYTLLPALTAATAAQTAMTSTAAHQLYTAMY